MFAKAGYLSLRYAGPFPARRRRGGTDPTVERRGGQEYEQDGEERGIRERDRRNNEIYRVTAAHGGYCFPISRLLCMGIRLKPSYTQEDSRVTAPAGP